LQDSAVNLSLTPLGGAAFLNSTQLSKTPEMADGTAIRSASLSLRFEQKRLWALCCSRRFPLSLLSSQFIPFQAFDPGGRKHTLLEANGASYL
jgi:hypothetical protein